MGIVLQVLSWIVGGSWVPFDDKDEYLEKVLEEGRIRDAALKAWRENSRSA